TSVLPRESRRSDATKLGNGGAGQALRREEAAPRACSRPRRGGHDHRATVGRRRRPAARPKRAWPAARVAPTPVTKDDAPLLTNTTRGWVPHAGGVGTLRTMATIETR